MALATLVLRVSVQFTYFREWYAEHILLVFIWWRRAHDEKCKLFGGATPDGVCRWAAVGNGWLGSF